MKSIVLSILAASSLAVQAKPLKIYLMAGHDLHQHNAVRASHRGEVVARPMDA